MITCFFENNKKVHLRHAVTDALIIQNNKILLVKRAPHLVEGGKYGIPGGFMELDESIEVCIKREVKEETGYEVLSQKLVQIISNPDRKDDRQNISFVFLVEVGKQVAEPDNESTEVRWFDLDKLPPLEQIAFDHHRIIQTYLENRLKPLPILA